MLLLWDIWYHLKNYIFDRLAHYFLKGCEALIEVFGHGDVLSRNYSATSSLKMNSMSFLKEVLLVSSILR